MSFERLLVTSALPYANGPLHVGHAIGAYLPADIYVRYNRLCGNDVLYICGSDEHGTPITVSAEKENTTPQKIVDRYHNKIKDAFSDLGISFDNFSRTTRDIHYKNSQKFFTQIEKNGFIYKKTVNRPFCPSCNRFLPDRFVKGVCPECKSEDQRGDQCEACGKQLEPHELNDSYCIICKGKPVQKETLHWFFKLSSFSDKLRTWIEENRHWPDNARNFSLGWITEGLEDRAITRDLSWGVPVPLPEAEGKVLYVWFDAPIGYISATQEWAEQRGTPEEWEKYWKNDSKIVHFIGKDNIPFHAIIWPAMLMAEGKYNLPWQISSNEYLTLEGKKMSTSRGWVLWLHDLLSEFDPDLVRYYLLSINPAKHDSDFSLKEFQHKVNNELLAAFGNFINRGLTFIEKQDSTIPEIKKFDELDEEMIEKIRSAPDNVGSNIKKFRFLEALKEVMALAHFGNEYFQKKEPWKNPSPETLYFCANLARSLAIVASPFLPFSSERIWAMLGLEGSVFEQSWESAGELGIKEGHRIGKVTHLYKKIEDKKINEFEKKYLKTKMDDTKKEEKKNYAEFSDFEKLGLKVGEILEAEDHPNADKIYKLKVDLGEENPRTILAGIKSAYKKEDLIGKQVIVVSNLKPRKIRGETSEGMLLAADGAETIVLLNPEQKVPPGSTVG